MEQKKRMILVGAVVAILAVAFLFMNLSTVNQKLSQDKDSLLKELGTIKKQNYSLAESNANATAKIKQLDEQLAKLQREASDTRSLVQAKEDLQKKYEQALKEKNELADRLAKAKPPVTETFSRPQTISTPSANLGDDLYWAGVLKEKTSLEVSLSKVNDELKALKAKFDEQQKAKVALESEIKNVKELDMRNLANDKLDLERRLAYSERTIDSLSLELVREKKDNRKLKEDYKAIESEKEALRNEISKLRGDINGLNSQIRAISDSKTALEDKLQKIELSKQDLERRVMAINALLDEKTSEIMDMKNRLEVVKQEQGLIPKPAPKYTDSATSSNTSVELPPIVVRTEAVADAPVKNIAYASAPSGMSGKILEVNTANNFVIIDIGKDSGIKPGDKLGVYKGNTLLANIEVIQARKNISAADIKKLIHPIKVGDAVK